MTRQVETLTYKKCTENKHISKYIASMSIKSLGQQLIISGKRSGQKKKQYCQGSQKAQVKEESAYEPSGPSGQSLSLSSSMITLGVFLLPPWMGC